MTNLTAKTILLAVGCQFTEAVNDRQGVYWNRWMDIGFP